MRETILTGDGKSRAWLVHVFVWVTSFGSRTVGVLVTTVATPIASRLGECNETGDQLSNTAEVR